MFAILEVTNSNDAGRGTVSCFSDLTSYISKLRHGGFLSDMQLRALPKRGLAER
jgi:hypothetical protein